MSSRIGLLRVAGVLEKGVVHPNNCVCDRSWISAETLPTLGLASGRRGWVILLLWGCNLSVCSRLVGADFCRK